jgi:hypothetical protein
MSQTAGRFVPNYNLIFMLFSTALFGKRPGAVVPAPTATQIANPTPVWLRTSLLGVALLLSLFSTQAQDKVVRLTTIRYVKAAATGDGRSWDNASGNLQAMIDASSDGDQVWIAVGLYKPGILPSGRVAELSRTASFSMKDRVIIYGGFRGTETTLDSRTLTYPSSTTLSGDIGRIGDNADNSYHVINNLSGLYTGAVLDGVVITGGNADGGSDINGSGGGVYNNTNGSNSYCSPTFRNCVFQNNNARSRGGAMFNTSNNGGNSSPVLINCAFQNNTANFGGAIYNFGNSAGDVSSPELTNCAFQSNSATTDGGAISNGAIISSDATTAPVLINCVFFGNGGAKTFANGDGGSVSATYSLFDNTVTGYNTTVTIITTDASIVGAAITTGNLTTDTSPFVSANSVALRAGSPAINAGDPNTPTATVGTTDLGGNLRNAGGRIDMGALEYQEPVGPTLVARAVSATVSGELSAATCPVFIQVTGVGDTFVFTNTTTGTVYSTVYRTPGTYGFSIPVNQPGSYTMTAYLNANGQSQKGDETQTVQVVGSGCP